MILCRGYYCKIFGKNRVGDKIAAMILFKKITVTNYSVSINSGLS